MRTLFLQMFLAFWVSTIGIFVVATALNPDGGHGNLENIFAFAQEDAAHVNNLVVGAYLRHGCKGLDPLGDHYALADSSGNVLCGEQVSAKVSGMIRSALAQRNTKAVHDSGMWFTITPVNAESQPYVVLHRRPYEPRPYFPRLPAVALPVSLAVTFLFAFFLTRPVRRLSDAFRHFSSGDLSVRLPVEKRRWSGLGGSDVRSLMVDFNHMADRIDSLVQAQKLLVRDVSHELRSPLARLRLALEMAREESVTPLPSFDRMEIETERVNDLIGQMLTLSLMESKGEISRKEMVDVTELVESLLPDLKFEAAARHCSIFRSVSAQPLLVSGNAELLRRAIENIVRNAIRFTREGTAVEIAAHLVDAKDISEVQLSDSHRMIAIDVADHGPGVPEKSLDLLFCAFYRTDAARRDSTGGFGVGLSIAERAVHLHNGRVSAKNRPGGGLIVSIYLPEHLHETTTLFSQ
jgi:two-component system sensor histidine kinase CpxA